MGSVSAIVVAVGLLAGKHAAKDTARAEGIVNVSYDPTRELYQTLDPMFTAAYEKASGRHVTVEQSHGGSSRQVRKVISGDQEAHVVSLGLRSDVGSLRKRVRHPDVVSLEAFEYFIKDMQANGMKIWLSGVQPDLLQAFCRLDLLDWYDAD